MRVALEKKKKISVVKVDLLRRWNWLVKNGAQKEPVAHATLQDGQNETRKQICNLPIGSIANASRNVSGSP